jgi:hypothetical protein
VDRLARHGGTRTWASRPRAAPEQLRSSASPEGAKAAGTAPPQFLRAIIDRERCARLPRSLARSAVDALHDRLVAVIAVLAERHLAQEEVAHLVDAIGLAQVEGVDDVADRLRHLLAAVEDEAVGEDARGSGRPADIRKAGQ